MHHADNKTCLAAALQGKSSAQSPTYGGEREGMFGHEHPSIFFSPPVQAKLTVNQPGDQYEQEADKVADQVVQRLAENQSEPASPEGGKNEAQPKIQRLPITPIQRTAMPLASSLIQAKCAACEGAEKLQKKEDDEPGVQSKIQRKPIFESNAENTDAPIQRREMPGAVHSWGTVQMKCADCAAEEEKPLQRTESANSAPTPSADFGSRLQSSKGGGSPLPRDVSSSMGDAMGADLSGVRVHTGSEAADMSQSIQAQAFTHGSDVYFNEGKYSLGSSDGKRLLAHELVHTVQQGGTGLKPESLGNGQSDMISREPNTDTEVVNDIEIKVTEKNPSLVYVPFVANRKEIAKKIYGDAALESKVIFASFAEEEAVNGLLARAVLILMPGILTQEIKKQIYEKLDSALEKDVKYIVDKLSERVTGGGDEWYLVMRTLQWSQRSNFRTEEGVNYFDKFLLALKAHTLSLDHWYTLTATSTSHDCLEWLLIETEEKSEQIKKAIKLRSELLSSSIRYDTTENAAFLETGEVVGRFYWGSGGAKNTGIQIRITERFYVSASLESALEVSKSFAHSGTGLGLTVIIPDKDQIYHCYYAIFPILDPLVLDPIGDSKGQYFWYYPNTMLISEHMEWEESVRDKFQTDVQNQNSDILVDLLMATSLANEIIKNQKGKLLPENVYTAWLEANKAMISFQANLTSADNEKKQLEAIEKLRNFYLEFRTFVSSLDKTEERCHQSECWTEESNPYLTLTGYSMYLLRLERVEKTKKWDEAIGDYYKFVLLFHKYIIDKLKESDQKEEAEKLDHFGRFSVEADKLLTEHPEAKKIRAVFYPLDSLSAKVDNKPVLPFAQGIPLYFYIYKEGGKWHLADLTTPKKVKINSEEGGTDALPPMSLFTELNNKLRFPYGRLFWELPGYTYTIRTTEPMSLSDWLSRIGLGLAGAAMILASGGLATPATILFVSSGLVSAGAAIADMDEKSEMGVLTSKDILIDVLSVVANLAGAAASGLGRIVTVGTKSTGNFAKLAVLADRLFIPAVGINLTTTGIVFITMASEVLTQFDELDEITDEKTRKLAKARLISQLLLTGGIILLSIKGDIANIKRGRNLMLDSDLLGQPFARPVLSVDELTTAFTKLKINNAEKVEELLEKSFLTKEQKLKIQADLTDIVLMSSIPRDDVNSIYSKLVNGKDADKIMESLAELRHANRVLNTGEAVQGASTVRLGIKNTKGVVEIDGQPVSLGDVPEVDVIYKGADGKIHMDEVKNTANGLRQKLDDNPRQLERMKKWQAQAPDTRQISIVVEMEQNWTEIFGVSKGKKSVIWQLIENNVPLKIGNRTLSPGKLQEIFEATAKKAKELGMFPPKGDFFDKMKTVEQAELFLGVTFQ